MSEVGIIEAAMEGVADLDGALATASEEEASDAAKSWSESEKMKNNKFIEGITSAERDPEGGYNITTDTGVKYNTKDVLADFNGRLSVEDPRDPNITEGFKKMGIKDSDLKSGDWGKVNETQKNGFRSSQQYKDFDNLRESKRASEGRTTPKNEDDFQRQTTKKLDDLNEKLEKISKGKGGKAGRWVKSAFKWVVGGLVASDIYGMVKDHQDSMNGCWLIAQKSSASTPPQKCKIDVLTCNPDCLKPIESNFTICSYCKDFTGNSSCMDGVFPEWNPAAPNCVKCGTKIPLPKPCGTGTKIPGQYDPKTGCPSGCPCTTADQACPNKNDNCSKLCNSANYGLPSNFVLQCVNADFWTAADDFFQGGIGDIEDLLKKIIKIVIIIIIILVLLALLAGGIKFIMNKISKK